MIFALLVSAACAAPYAPVSVSSSAHAPLVVGQAAPFTGVLLSNDYAQNVFELAADGKAARRGEFTLPFWKTATLLTVNAVLVGIETYRFAHKK